jgi:hypothetical protein
VVALSLSAGRSSETTQPEQIANPGAPVTEVAPMIDPTAGDTAPTAADTAPTPTESAAPAKPPAQAGQRKRSATKVQSRPPSKSRSKPCTPDRFDYPACLGR